MKRHRYARGLSVAVLTALLSLSSPAGAEAEADARPTGTAKTVDGKLHDWNTTAPKTAGASALADGEYVYTDYLFDDTGKPTGLGGWTNRGDYRGQAATGGDYAYPTDPKRCAHNCADLREVRLSQDGDRLHVAVTLNTMLVEDATVAALAIGPYGQDGGTPRAWPLGANLSTPGTQHVLTLWGSGGAFDQSDLSEVGGEVAVDLGSNTIEASVPLSALGTGPKFRAYLGTGLWDPAARSWQALQASNTTTKPGGGAAGDPRVFNLGFRAGEKGHWFDNQQAAALKSGDVSALHADIDLTAPDREPPALQPGFHQRIFTSSATVPRGDGLPSEGVVANGVRGRGNVYVPNYGTWVPTEFHFVGSHLPYAVYVPDSGIDRMTMVLHGGYYTHGTMTLQTQFIEMAEQGRTVLVAPFARGVTNFATDYAHLAMLETYDDARATFPTADPERTALWGYSMGGLSANRLSVLHPDLFASSVQWEAASGMEEDKPAGGTGNGYPVDLADNTAWTNTLIRHCEADNVAPYSLLKPWTDRLEALKHPYRLWTLSGGCDHLNLASPETAPDLGLDAEATEQARIPDNPPHVRFKTSEEWWRPDISPRLVFNSAWWVDDVRVRDTSAGLTAYGTVDALTQGHGGYDQRTEALPEREGSTGTYPYTETGRAPQQPGTPIEKANAFTATLTNVSSATLDRDRMGLSAGEPLTATLESDGAATLRLTGAAGMTAESGCSAVSVRSQGDDLLIDMARSSQCTLRLAP
ncbi:hypothetical protein [Streptomyces luteolus]|uniref:Peptidase S9 prolyl oligopeptidase catalytic domain-containing protein n=1 Tax=Streptomyces luteolus TaxID=3043615 RepID=A0ABT6SRZ0_9ACTN|nr:hypothetical protein [Streptomyces sp. B-S-A12]MDI3417609.1 hypothetical protein [Streptomyces sp. B-S-A12]